jgi:hypothetical protein
MKEYKSVPLKPVFTVKVKYKHIGKLKPRPYKEDDGKENK